jgi:hypothetical protein
MTSEFMICTDNESYPVDLTVHMVYKVLPDEKAEQRGWICVIDNSGEDYLYPARKFVAVQIPAEAGRSFDLVTT